MPNRRTVVTGLALTALLATAAALAVPVLRAPTLPPLPDGPVVLERHELAPTLRRRVQQALEAQGLTTSGQTRVTLSAADCPAACNAGMERGLCYCPRDPAGVCAAGWPLERGDPASVCASLPAQVQVQPQGAGSPPLTLTF